MTKKKEQKVLHKLFLVIALNSFVYNVTTRVTWMIF